MLKTGVTDETIEELKAIGAEEVCPRAKEITAEKVAKWHREGFNVRAWGVGNEELMKQGLGRKASKPSVFILQETSYE